MIHDTLSTLNSEISDTIRNRNFDITPITQKAISIFINGKEAIAYKGETVLTTLLAHGIKKISKNSHEEEIGAYCGMGVCFCCTVFINNHKKRSCKTQVYDGMRIQTVMNTSDFISREFQLKNQDS